MSVTCFLDTVQVLLYQNHGMSLLWYSWVWELSEYPSECILPMQ